MLSKGGRKSSKDKPVAFAESETSDSTKLSEKMTLSFRTLAFLSGLNAVCAGIPSWRPARR